MISTGSETVIGNARIVLADRVIERGWVAFADGRIADGIEMREQMLLLEPEMPLDLTLDAGRQVG